MTTLTGHVLRTPRLSKAEHRSDRGRPDVRTQFMVRSSDDPSQLVRICCSDRVADYAVKFLRPGDRIRAIGTLKEVTFTVADGKQVSGSPRFYAEDLTALREDAE